VGKRGGKRKPGEKVSTDCVVTHAVSVGGNSIAYYQLSLISFKFAVMNNRLQIVLRYAEHSSMSHCLSVNRE